MEQVVYNLEATFEDVESLQSFVWRNISPKNVAMILPSGERIRLMNSLGRFSQIRRKPDPDYDVTQRHYSTTIGVEWEPVDIEKAFAAMRSDKPYIISGTVHRRTEPETHKSLTTMLKRREAKIAKMEQNRLKSIKRTAPR